MKAIKINGFNERQIFQLYDFLVSYEDSGIQQYKSTKALIAEHPELSDIDQILKSVEKRQSNHSNMVGIDFKALNNHIYLTKNKGNLSLSFLAHLRNSIAHGSAVEFEGKILITDYENPKYHPTNFTARGCIDFTIINNITNFLKCIIL